jgi:hypothetical protein
MIDGQRQTESDNQRNRLPPERIEIIIIALLAAASILIAAARLTQIDAL